MSGIAPALTPEEWAAWQANVSSRMVADDLVKIIARTNALLPDDDPRKITRKDVAAALKGVEVCEGMASEMGTREEIPAGR